MAEDQNVVGIRDAVPSAGSPGTSVQVLESHGSSCPRLYRSFPVIPFFARWTIEKSSVRGRSSPFFLLFFLSLSLSFFSPASPARALRGWQSAHWIVTRGRADGSEGAEILERRSRELVRPRRWKLVDVALSRTRVPSSVVQVNDSSVSLFLSLSRV